MLILEDICTVKKICCRIRLESTNTYFWPDLRSKVVLKVDSGFEEPLKLISHLVLQ